MGFSLVCTRCAINSPASGWRWQHACGGPLDIIHDVRGQWLPGRGADRPLDMTRYRELLPVTEPPPVHVGWTPVFSHAVAGCRVQFKLEYLSVGGSFKDRGAYVALARAKELGARRVVIDSSGNAAISHALFGPPFGIDVDVYLPAEVPEGKRSVLHLLRARVHEVEGDRMETNRCALAAERDDVLYVGHWWNPYFIDGVKTIAYEAVEQCGGFDAVIVPVGAGTLLLGIHKGCRELVQMGAIARMPRFIGVQPVGYTPVAAAFERTAQAGKGSTLADGIAIADPPRRAQIVAAIRETDGSAVTVSDEDVRRALDTLIGMGFMVEPTAAVNYAGLHKAVSKGSIAEGSMILLPLTGSGLKVAAELVALR
ncbi:MAG: pyridoxal-phosphate dependent enzyme [Chloroflexota bacterium]